MDTDECKPKPYGLHPTFPREDASETYLFGQSYVFWVFFFFALLNTESVAVYDFLLQPPRCLCGAGIVSVRACSSVFVSDNAEEMSAFTSRSVLVVKAGPVVPACALQRYLLIQTSASAVNWQLPPRLLL